MNKKIIVLSSVISDSASNMVDIQRVIMKYLLLFILNTSPTVMPIFWM